MRPRKQAAQPLLLTNVGQLLTLRGGDGPRRGRELRELGIIEDAAVLCVAGKIVSVGTEKEAAHDGWVKQHKRDLVEVDCKGGVLLPGFVDSHTHPVFTSPRLVDFEKRIGGASYERIAEAGGGIRSSVAGVRAATRKQLCELALNAFREMAAQGTTTIEAKSGYGLSVEAEIKSLEAIRDAAKQFAGTIVSTLLGAHVVPDEYRDNRDEYVRVICEQMIPQAESLADFVDVFWDRGAFTEDEAAQVFETARQHGLGLRAHVCQLSPASLKNLCQYSPASFDHMDHVLDEELEYLAERNTVATLLPGANYFLGLKQFPPARKLVDAGVPVALATDYNPGTSPTVSMPFVLSLACTHMKMSPAEAITASTINGAHALRRAERKGSIEPGKDADLAVFDVQDYREIPYWFAAEKCVATVANGVVFPRRDSIAARR
jgi:imidazolonepropionase